MRKAAGRQLKLGPCPLKIRSTKDTKNHEGIPIPPRFFVSFVDAPPHPGVTLR